MKKVSALVIVVAATTTLLSFVARAQAPAPLKVPNTVRIPDIEPLIPNCADPAADHFVTLDMWSRAPAGATKIQAMNAWLTPDGVFHWPLVMRVRNVGDQPFIGKPGKQRAVVTEDDVLANKKGREAGSNKFDRIEPRGAFLVHFEFTASRADVEAQRFHRIYTLTLELDETDQKLLESKYGDCHPKNNKYFIEIDGSRKGWIFGN